MLLAPYLFKSRALRAMKGNWQTALLVTFFSGLFTTILQLLRYALLPDAVSVEAMLRGIEQLTASSWLLLSLCALLAVLFTPMLSVGCCHYFVCRLTGTELGFSGLWSRKGIWLKTVALYVVMYVKVFLWGLLLVVPGVIAAIRYSMAPYYMADNPELTALEAIEKSKAAMQGRKMSLFMLEVSFFGWLLLSTLAELLLYEFSVIFGMVVGQFLSLFVATYINGACTAFYLAVSSPKGIRGEIESAAKGDPMAEMYMSRMPWSGEGADEGDKDDKNDRQGQ